MLKNLTELRTLLQVQFDGTAIPLCLVEKGKSVLQFPATEHPVFTPEFIRCCLVDYLYLPKESGLPLILRLHPGYFLGIAQLDADQYLFYGPVSEQKLSLEDLKDCFTLPLYYENRDMLRQLLLGTPPVQMTVFLNSFRIGIYLCTGKLIQERQIQLEDLSFINHGRIKKTLANYIYDIRENFTIHTPQQYEEQIFQAIEKGSTSDFESLRDFGWPSVGMIGTLSLDQERQARYLFVVIGALSCRAAVRGGLNYEMACSMEDIYCQRMDRCSSIQQIQNLSTQMILDFCRAVQDLKEQRQYSSKIQLCIDYLSKHTHQKITLEDLAELCGMSARRLSQQFRAQVGESIADYSHRCKIEEAKLLLRHTSKSISEISSSLCYQGQSYFTMIFRKYTGMTPAQFREK